MSTPVREGLTHVLEVGDNTPRIASRVELTQRSSSAAAECLERNGKQCVVTGSMSGHGFALEVAHIILYALAN